MTDNDILKELLAHLRAENKPILIDWDMVQYWPDGVLDRFLMLGLLVPTAAAQSIVNEINNLPLNSDFIQ